mgnify:CR=1 FL=1
MTLEEGLQGVRFFEFLTEEEREEFAEASEPVSFRTGETIIEEGAEPGSLYVLTSGRVEVRKRLDGDRDRLLAELHARGIGAGVHYPIPIHEQAPYAGIRTSPSRGTPASTP